VSVYNGGQVSTWFANARRRLKKENKMHWSTNDADRKSRDDDDYVDDDVSCDYNEGSDYDLGSSDECHGGGVAVDRRQVASAVAQQPPDMECRLGKYILIFSVYATFIHQKQEIW